MKAQNNVTVQDQDGNSSKPLLFTGRVSKEGSELDTKIEWKSVKIWKPNIIQKLLIKLRIIKDPRFNGKYKNRFFNDEVGQFGIDPFENDK